MFTMVVTAKGEVTVCPTAERQWLIWMTGAVSCSAKCLLHTSKNKNVAYQSHHVSCTNQYVADGVALTWCAGQDQESVKIVNQISFKVLVSSSSLERVN